MSTLLTLMHKTSGSSQEKKDYYKKVIREYSRIVQAIFLSRVRIKKPYQTFSQESLNFHVKQLMLYQVLPKLRDNDPDLIAWPPPKINQTIDIAVNEYIETLE